MQACLGPGRLDRLAALARYFGIAVRRPADLYGDCHQPDLPLAPARVDPACRRRIRPRGRREPESIHRHGGRGESERAQHCDLLPQPRRPGRPRAVRSDPRPPRQPPPARRRRGRREVSRSCLGKRFLVSWLGWGCRDRVRSRSRSGSMVHRQSYSETKYLRAFDRVRNRLEDFTRRT